jgi:hypothetical protein
MKTVFALALVSLSLALPVAVAAAPRIVITPAVDGIIRDGIQGPRDGVPDFIIDGGAAVIQALDTPPQEDRAIVEFDISNLSHPVKRARLVLSVFSSNGPFPFRIEVFSYAGDGVLSLSDWDSGTLHTSFKYSGRRKTIRLDVTSVINNLLASGEGHVGFNIQFAMQSPIELNGPFIAFHSLELPPAPFLRVNDDDASDTE